MKQNNRKTQTLTIEWVKELAEGREIDILRDVAGIPDEILGQDRREHPCPKCGGNTRCRLLDRDKGAVFCNHCFNEKNGDFIAAVQHFRSVDLPESLRLIGGYLGIDPTSNPLGPAESGKTAPKKLVGTWQYVKLDGTPCYRVKRFEWVENGEPKKSFFQERFAGGQWLTGLKDIEPVPYNWAAISESPRTPAYIVEGEKCADALISIRIRATTASGGSNSKLDWSKFILDRQQVVIIPDNDKPGYEYALRVADQLHEGHEVKVVFLPGLAPKGDIADWIAAGGTREELVRIVKETPVWDGKPFLFEVEREDAEPFEKPKKPAKGSVDVIRRPRLIDPNTLEEKETDWLWPNKIPLGELSLLAGMPGQGKTFWSCYMTAIITNGWNWADGTPCPQGSVLFFYGEDSIDRVYKPRLRANGADQSKVRFLDGVEVLQPGKDVAEVAFSIGNVEDIEAAIVGTERETGSPVRLVVIDPIANYWGDVKENSNAEVRSVLKPLQRLAERTGAAFLLILHTGKGDKDHAQQRVLGSTGIVASCRAVWGLYPAPEKWHRYFAPVKANGCIEPTTVEFTIDRTAGGQVQIVSGSLEMTGDNIESDLRSLRQQRGPKAEKLEECCDWLQEFLRAGERPANEVMEAAEEAGFSKGTIRRAKESCGVVSQKETFSKRWIWTLFSTPDEDAQVSQNKEDSENLRIFSQSLQGKELRRNEDQDAQVVPIYKQLAHLGEITVQNEPSAPPSEAEEPRLERPRHCEPERHQF